MKRIIIVFVVLGFQFCNSESKNHNEIVQEKKIEDTATKTKTTREDLRETCTRGQAEPILNKSVFPNSKFELLGDSLSGIEAVDLGNGDKLTIRNWGCEYYVLTFNFETSRFKRDTADIVYWYKETTELLYEISKGVDAPIDIQKGTREIVNQIDLDEKNKYKNLKFGQEIDFGESEIRTFVC